MPEVTVLVVTRRFPEHPRARREQACPSVLLVAAGAAELPGGGEATMPRLPRLPRLPRRPRRPRLLRQLGRAGRVAAGPDRAG